MFDENVIVNGTEENKEDDAQVKQEGATEHTEMEESNGATKDEGMAAADDNITNDQSENANINANININLNNNELNVNNTSNNTQNFISQMGHLTTKEKESTISESTNSPSKEEISSTSEHS